MNNEIVSTMVVGVLTNTDLSIGNFSISLADLKKQFAPNASDAEFRMYAMTAAEFGLNPVKRECYFVKYGNSPGQTLIGYEIYLKRADRTGKLDGWAIKINPDGSEATIKIYRKDWENPFIWTVYSDECNTGKALWKTKPKFMLRKVAIAQAFRLAFPDELGGMPYTSDELPEEMTGVTTEPSPLATAKAGLATEAKAVVAEKIAEPQEVEELTDLPPIDPPPAPEPAPEPATPPPAPAPVEEKVVDEKFLTDPEKRRILDKFTALGMYSLEDLEAYAGEGHGLWTLAHRQILVVKYKEIVARTRG